jgi:hypothetical protein
MGTGLPEALAALLRTPGSARAVLVRAQLTALVTAVDALEPHLTAPDPGVASWSSVRAGLAAALAAEPTAAEPSTVAAPPSTSSNGGVLAVIAEDFAADPEVTLALGRDAVTRSTTDRDRWTALHLACLRLPDKSARPWRARLAATVAADPAADRWIDLPAVDAGTILLPPWPSRRLPGVRTTPGWPLPDEIADGVSGGAAALGQLAALAVQALWLSENDPQLQDFVAGRDLTRPEPLSSDAARRRYRTELLRRLRTATVGGGPELVQLDEALCSLVHLPPAAPTSWWHTFAQRGRQIALTELTRLGLAVRSLDNATYEHVLPLCQDSVACLSPRPGQVLRCLRMWCTADGRARPGRVIYGARR